MALGFGRGLHVLNSRESSLRSRSLVFWVEQTNHFLMQRALKIRAGTTYLIYKKMLRNNEEFKTFNNSKIDALAKTVMNAPFGINT